MTSLRSLKVLIVDDHPVFRLGFKQILESFKSISKIYEANNGEVALKKIRSFKIDLVFLDITMPKMNGYEFLDKLNDNPESKPKIIVVSMWVEKYAVLTSYGKGIDGYITKHAGIKEITRLLERVKDKENYYSPAVYKILLKEVFNHNKKGIQPANNNLTEVERVVMKYICRQQTNDEIGENMFLSPNTIKRHRQRIKDKIGAKNIVGFIHYSLENGIVSLSEMKLWMNEEA